MIEATELRSGLSNFWGSEQFFRHNLNRKMLYTEGVQWFAQNAGNGAYWFLDIVATEVMELAKTQPFIHVKLNVRSGAEYQVLGIAAWIEADDGNGNVLFTRQIEYTDCPEGEWGFYLEDNGQGATLLLPGEH